MKVRTLIEILSKLDWDKEIYLASDSEGNSYSNPSDILIDEKYCILYPDDSYLQEEDLQ